MKSQPQQTKLLGITLCPLAYCPPATPEPKALIAPNKLVLKIEARFASDSNEFTVAMP